MCGLVGVINPTNFYKVDYDNYFKQALLCDSVRGKHSTGICLVDKVKHSFLFKRAINAIEFLAIPAVDRAITSTNQIMMGHNRFATKGGINDDTAHPFRHGAITLCHNGTLTAHKSLTDISFDVDSEAICYAISKANNPVEVLEKLEGAFALTWYNSDEGTFNIARNSERKLYIAKVKNKHEGDNGVYLYASEYGMLVWLAYRNDLDIEKPTIVPVGEILTWDVHNKCVEPVSTKFTPRPITKMTDWYNVPYYNRGSSNTTHTTYPSRNPDEGMVVDVVFYAFQGYQHGIYGEVSGYFDDDYKTVVLAGKTELEAEELIAKKSVKIKITSYDNAKQKFYGILFYQPPTTTTIKGIDTPPTNSENIINLIKMIEDEENLSNNQKKKESANFCRNCDEVLSEANLFVSFDKQNYCIDCAEMHPESIFR